MFLSGVERLEKVVSPSWLQVTLKALLNNKGPLTSLKIIAFKPIL